MPQLTIDNRQVEVPAGATILEAAGKLGIDIPALCFLEGYAANTSCMVCVVKVNGRDRLIPSCGTAAEQGMQVESETAEIHQARRAALELLLSDHAGDCLAPCQSICPARMNIPLMIRQIAGGALSDALATVKADIALPAVLGRICPAPCEKGCRRAVHDSAVSICLLKRYVADVDMALEEPYQPICKPDRGKQVAIVGAGPAGLAAAYHLLQKGYRCTVFDDHEKPGGMLQYGVGEEVLPRHVLEAEIALIRKLGANFQLATRIGAQRTLRDLQRDFDAIFVAVGQLKAGAAEQMGLAAGPGGIEADNRTCQTALSGVFAGGDAIRPRKLAVRAVADGKAAATAIDQYLSAQSVTGPQQPFSTHIGKLQNGEMDVFLAEADAGPRTTPSRGPQAGFTDDEARAEALRCLHCDCRKPTSCKLRQYARQYDARPSRFKGPRRLFEQQLQHPSIIYEPGKCIACGLCVRIATRAGENLGLTFIGRGFNVRVAVPFKHSLAEGLAKAAAQCAAACPTGALALRSS